MGPYDLRNQKPGTSVHEKMEFKFQELAECENGVLKLQQPLFKNLCEEIKSKHQNFDIAVITAVGPPQSGKSSLLQEALEELVIRTRTASHVIFHSAVEADLQTNCRSRLLITTPCVATKSCSGTDLVVFGLDMDVRDYNVDSYNKLVEFALTLSSIAIVSIPAYYDPTLWDGTKCFTKFFGEDRLQKVGFAIFLDNTCSVPCGAMATTDFQSIQAIDDNKQKLVREASKAFALTAHLSVLPLTNNKNREGPAAYRFRFFSNLFQNLEAVQRRKAVLSVQNAHTLVPSFCDRLNVNSKSASPMGASSYFQNQDLGHTTSCKDSRSKNDQDTDPWYVKAYDFYFKGQRGDCVYLQRSDIERIHKDVCEEVRKTMKEKRQKAPNLDKILNQKLEEQVLRETSAYNAYISVESQLNEAILVREYELAAQALCTPYSINYLCNKNRMETVLLSCIDSSPTEFQPYCLSICRAYQADFLSTIHLIGFYCDNIRCFLDMYVCVEPETLSQQHSNVRAQVLDQVQYVYEPTKDRLTKLLETSISNNYAWFCETNKTRCVLEKHLSMLAIERILAKYASAMSRFVSNRILTNHHIQHIHDQLYRSAINSFLLRTDSSSRKFKITASWESSLSTLEAGLLEEFKKVSMQNARKLENYLKRRKHVIKSCMGRYSAVLAKSSLGCRLSHAEARSEALESFHTQVSTEDIHFSCEWLETLETALSRTNHQEPASNTQTELTATSEMDYDQTPSLSTVQQHNSSYASSMVSTATEENYGTSTDEPMDESESPSTAKSDIVYVDYKENVRQAIIQLESREGNFMGSHLKNKIDECKAALKRPEATQDEFKNLERSLQVVIKTLNRERIETEV